MPNWKLEREEEFFRIFDSKKQIAGYFDPEYGDLVPKEKEYEIIEKMHQNQEKFPGGFLTVPMVKFGIFQPDTEMNLNYLTKQLGEVAQRIEQWKNFLEKKNNPTHFIRISHTDQDMLSITIPLKFPQHIPLEKKIIEKYLEPTLNSLHELNLL